MKLYAFSITINGLGNTPEEAWTDAVREFYLEPGEYPSVDEYNATEIDEQVDLSGTSQGEEIK
jgi:hypothetical protein